MTHHKTGGTLPPPHWMPIHLDQAAGRVLFRELDLAAFRRAPFHDGRTRIITDRPADARLLSDVIAAWRAATPAPDRLLLHQSFCGSTLLARALQMAGCAASYREPQILIQALESHAQRADQPATEAILALFRRAPQGEQPCVVKPSNWVNPYLAAHPVASAPGLVLLRIDLVAFLLANLRGGKDRLGYSLSLLNLHLSMKPSWKPLIADINRMTGTSPVRAPLHMLAVLHALQEQDFQTLAQRNADRGNRPALEISHRGLTENLRDTLDHVCRALGLNPAHTDVEQALAPLLATHAKSHGINHFRLPDQSRADNALFHEFRDDIIATETWAATHLHGHSQP
ncbi:hypothetical protein [Yunchengibacter salinarum]|uniref:hypothetical protein n=1 Tax=Yunchengibacter salinarum TaxID=3133399 RepID=UPI0035B620BB